MQKAISGLPFALLLAGLAPAAAGAAPAPTSKALLRSGTEEPYFALKRTFQKMFDDGEIQVEVLREWVLPSGPIERTNTLTLVTLGLSPICPRQRSHDWVGSNARS